MHAISEKKRAVIAQDDQDLHCPFTESIDTVVYVDEEKMLGSNCIDAQIHLVICDKGFFPR